MPNTSDRYKQKQNTHRETSTPPYSHWLQLVSDPGATRQNNKLLYCHKWDGRIRISLFFSNFFPCFSTPQKIYQNFDQEDTCLAIMCLDGCHYPFSLRSLSKANSRLMICVRRFDDVQIFIWKHNMYFINMYIFYPYVYVHLLLRFLRGSRTFRVPPSVSCAVGLRCAIRQAQALTEQEFEGHKDLSETQILGA